MIICKLINLVILIFICSKQIVVSNDELQARVERLTNEVIRDLPVHNDLWTFHTSLERIIDFWTQRKHELTINVMFGLFLVNVNLRPFVNDPSLPKYIKDDLYKLLFKNDQLHQYYRENIAENRSSSGSEDQKKLLYENLLYEARWSMQLEKFNLNLINSSAFNVIEFPEWNVYAKDVDDIDRWIPTPKQSDMCLEYLALNEENLPEFPRKCKIPARCRQSQELGTNFGYALTHRFIFLMFARLSRSCVTFSPDQDEYLRHYYCTIMYSEAEFNADNDFKIADLMFEQMTLCSLDGHVQFLRRSWLNTLIRHQTPPGCFMMTLSPPRRVTCNDHVTSVAASTLAAALRFLLENYETRH